MPKLERFKREADKPTTKHILISAGIIVGLLAIFAVYKSFALYTDKKTHDVIKSKIGSFDQEDMILTYTIDGVKNDLPFPKKINGYVANSVTCQNGVTASWDSESWGLVNINANNQTKIKCNVDFDDIWEFDYIGDVQEFIAPKAGTYKIELWGAEGGANSETSGGKGAYTTGKISLTSNLKLYVYVGEHPTYYSGSCYSTNPNSSFNGSIQGACAGGGGSTDIRLTKTTNWYDNNSLASRIMVAGAGGGAAYNTGIGGAGGELEGVSGTGMSSAGNSAYHIGSGATQISYWFGQGMYGSTTVGGAGYYGGQAGYGGNAGGGSSYISGYQGCIAITSVSDTTPICTEDKASIDVSCSYHYSGYKFTEMQMIGGDKEMTSPTGITEIGHSGNGYARITLIS